MATTAPYPFVRNVLWLRRLGIDTHQEAVVYMREDCEVCRSEGLDSLAQVHLTHDGRIDYSDAASRHQRHSRAQ